jgi:putative two-component system response regulator
VSNPEPIPERQLAETRLGCILVVGDEPVEREILVGKMMALGYECDSCRDGEEAVRVLGATEYDLVLCDIESAGRPNGTALLDRIREIRPDTAVIFITPVMDLATAVTSLKEGAYDYITKPFTLADVSAGVACALNKRRLLMQSRDYQRALEEQVAGRTEQLKRALDVLQDTYHSTLMALSTALDSREPDSEGHSLRLTLYAMRLAREVGGMSEEQFRVLEQGALLHDIGKIGVPDGLLRKPARLTEAEWVLMKRHPEIGFRILSGIKVLRGAAQLVLQHQERYDGTGYPRGLLRDAILREARIFAVIDTLDGMTTHRPFQTAMAFEEAQVAVARLAGTQLDPEIVKCFLSVPLSVWRQIREQIADRTRRSPRSKEPRA